MKYRKPRIPNENKLRAVTDYNARIPIAKILKRNKMSKMTLYRILKEVIKHGKSK